MSLTFTDAPGQDHVISRKKARDSEEFPGHHSTHLVLFIKDFLLLPRLHHNQVL